MIQNIGVDLGRGFTKAYSEYKGKSYECIFRSLSGIVSKKNVEVYPEYIEDNIHLTLNGLECFVGELAEKESKAIITNLDDDKTELGAEILLYTVLYKLAKTSNVNVLLGVPHKIYNKEILKEVKDKYKGKEILIKNNITKEEKSVTINDIKIYREADAALVYHARDVESFDRPLGLVSVGYRTTELCYYDKKFNYVERDSDTFEKGNITVLEHVQSMLVTPKEPIKKELYEIDSSDDYDDIKKGAYELLKNILYQDISTKWKNKDEMDIVFAGGTPYRLGKLRYPVIKDSQLATSRGLYIMSNKIWY